VTEHRIRLRGGWECIPIDGPASEAFRLTLPTRWEAEGPRRLRLIRRFSQPRTEAGTEVVLQMEQVPGIRRLQIDGQSTPPGSPERSEFELALDGSAARHLLILEIETPIPDDPVTAAPEWGVIALVIRRTCLQDPHP
jgi:hypothetical protein